MCELWIHENCLPLPLTVLPVIRSILCSSCRLLAGLNPVFFPLVILKELANNQRRQSKRERERETFILSKPTVSRPATGWTESRIRASELPTAIKTKYWSCLSGSSCLAVRSINYHLGFSSSIWLFYLNRLFDSSIWPVQDHQTVWHSKFYHVKLNRNDQTKFIRQTFAEPQNLGESLLANSNWEVLSEEQAKLHSLTAAQWLTSFFVYLEATGCEISFSLT